MTTPTTPTASEHCSRCGAAFQCGMNSASPCWCAALPPLPGEALQAARGCLCPACLSEAVAHYAKPRDARNQG